MEDFMGIYMSESEQESAEYLLSKSFIISLKKSEWENLEYAATARGLPMRCLIRASLQDVANRKSTCVLPEQLTVGVSRVVHGDILIIRLAADVDRDEIEAMTAGLKPMMPDGVHALIIPSDAQLHVIRSAAQTEVA